MIIDINATLGHYPFRQMAARSAAEMVALMDRWTIDRAVISSMHAVFYRDAQRGNQELYEQTNAYAQRFACVATINPKYVQWQQDLVQCLEQWHMCAVSLVPEYHGYSLTDVHGKAAIEAIIKTGRPLVLTQRFEDRRQRHAWDIAEDLQQNQVIEIAKQYRDLKLVLCNWNGLDGGKLKAAGLAGRCLIDFARMDVLLHQDVPKLIAALGIESIAFGSHMPFDYCAPSLVKLSNLETLPKEDWERIAWRNATEFFKLN